MLQFVIVDSCSYARIADEQGSRYMQEASFHDTSVDCGLRLQDLGVDAILHRRLRQLTRCMHIRYSIHTWNSSVGTK